MEFLTRVVIILSIQVIEDNLMMRFLIVSILLLSALNIKYASAAAAAGWINVEAYDTSSPNCTGLSSGYASYATGVCLLGTTGSYQYQATVTTDASKVSIVKYTFTNYTDTVCQTVNKVISLSYAEGSCVVRTPLSSGDFNFPYYYTYAVYSYTSGSIPVLPPYPGVVKTYYSDPTCQVVDAYKLKIFNQAYCFDTIYGSPYPGGAKYNCDGTVSSYTNNTCKKLNPPPSTKTPTLVPTQYPSPISLKPSAAPVVKPTYPVPNVPGVCTAAPNGYSTKQTCGNITASLKPAFKPTASGSSSSSSCFSYSETVLLSSGETRTIANIQLGDEIAVASMDGTFAGYSPVIAVPHAANSIKATFAQITTVSGRDINMTPDHLVLGGACGSPSLVQAGYLKTGECVQTVFGAEVIASVATVAAEGIYTVVTKHDGLLIVNGIVASPFAVNHQVATAFYSIHRLFFGMLPSIGASKLLTLSFEAFGDLFASI